MEMNQIRYFLAVCTHRNFTHAASASNVSQPSLTTAIKKLEAELGGPLFLRDRAGCRLTPLGLVVQPRIETVYNETLAAKAEAARHIMLDRIPISIGVGETIGCDKLSQAVEHFRTRLPQAEIELIVAPHDTLLAGLHDGTLDLAVTSGHASQDLYRIDLLYREGYRAVVATGHRLAESGTVSLDILAQTNLLDRPNCEMRDALHGACADRGHTLYAAYRSNRVDWLLALARQGSGVVVLPVTAIPVDHALASMAISEVDIERQVVALRFRQQASRPETDALVRDMAQGQNVFR